MNRIKIVWEARVIFSWLISQKQQQQRVEIERMKVRKLIASILKWSIELLGIVERMYIHFFESR